MKNIRIAVDLGASSGRLIAGYDGKEGLITEEIHRFGNGVKKENGSLVWDIDSIFNEIVTGLKKCFEKYAEIDSLAIDSWGVDYALIKDGKAIKPVYAYRDGRTESAIKAVHGIIPFEKLYERTGISFQPFNTVYQLYADKLNGRLHEADAFLMIPEYLNYLLTGVMKKEYTNASTTGLVNAETKEFDKEIISALGLNEKLFSPLSDGGETVGNLKPEIAEKVGGNLTVKLCLSHDTASAFYTASKLGGKRSALLSSGTWSLLGTVTDVLHNGQNARECGFTNEGGYKRTFRFLKNIMGMWVVNNAAKECGLSPKDFCDEAESSEYNYTVNVNDAEFFAPESMTEAIKAHLKKSGAPAPKSTADLASCVIYSLAKSYAESVKEMEKIAGQTFDDIVIVGGGAKNKTLNALTEKFSGKKVIAEPIEATAIGNILIQRGE